MARSTNQVVTELIIDASGSLRGAAEHVRATREAELASNKLSDAEEKARIARENGAKSYVGASTSLAKVRAEYTNLATSLDPALRVQLRHQREMENAILRTDAAVRRGVASEVEAMQVISRLRARQVQEINAVKDATQNLVRVQAAANDNAQGFNTANIAAQFQDIGVTAAMGMSPIQIALQQGTQLSSVLMSMDRPLRGLLAGFMALLSPVSLLTIGLIAAGVAALQYFTSAEDAADTATDVIQAHDDAIRELKSAYEEAGDGAKEYLAETAALAQATVIIAQFKLAEQFKAEVDTMLEDSTVFATATESISAEIDRLNAKMAEFSNPQDPAAQALFVQVEQLYKALETAGNEASTASEKFEPFRSEIENFLKTVRAGKPDIVALSEAIASRINAEPTNQDLAMLGEELLDVASSAREMQTRLDAAGGSVVNLDKVLVDSEAELRNYERALADIERQLDGFRNQADGLLDKFFPAEAAKREAAELGELLRQFGGDLDSFQRRAVENERDELLLAAHMGLRRLPEETRENGAKAADELRETLGEAFQDLFSNGMRDADAFFDTLIQGFARIGQLNLENAFDRLFGTGGKSKGGNAGAPNLGSIGGFLGDFFGGARQQTEPLRAANTNLAAAMTMASTKISGSMENYLSAIRKVESGSYAGNYSAMGPVIKSGMYAGDRAYGAFQVMGNNIASWTKEALGTSLSIKEWIGNKSAQDKTAAFHLQKSLDKFGSFSDAASVWFSGQPFTERVANRSDGFNSVSQYVQKANSALAGLPDAVQAGATVGTDTGVQSGFKGIGSDYAAGMNAVAGGLPQNAPIPTANPGQPGGGAFGGAFGQNLQIGLGAFGMGAQSGDPLSGALGGAMSGMALGPIGMAIGGIGGLLGGIFGRSRRKRQEREAARKALEEQRAAIMDLLDFGEDTVTGSITRQIREYQSEVAKAAELASKAGDRELADRLKASVGTLEKRLVKEFAETYTGNLEAMNLGFGVDNAFQRGADAVRELGDQLRGFVDNAKTAGMVMDEAANALAAANDNLRAASSSLNPLTSWNRGITPPPGGFTLHDARDIAARHARGEIVMEAAGLNLEGLTNLRASINSDTAGDDDGFALADALKAAQKAAKEYIAAQEAANAATGEAIKLNDAQRAAINSALATLDGPSEISALEEQLMELRGKAAALPPVLQDIGMTAEEAAKAVEDRLAVAIGKLRDNLRDDLEASINELSGFGFLNEITDAFALYEERVKDSAAVGLDGALAMREFSLSLNQIVTDAGLTREQIQLLASVFPTLAGVFTDIINQTGLTSLADAQAAVERAQADLRAAYQKESSAVESLIERHKRFAKSVKEIGDNLRLDSNLSPLGNRERLNEALKQYQDTVAKALTGDEDAQSRYDSVLRTYLDEAKSFYGSSEQYFSIFEEVQAINEKVYAATQDQISEAERQLETLKTQVGKLIDIDDSVLSVADAIAALNAANSAQNAALLAQLSATAALTSQAITSAYQAALGRAPEQAGMDFWKDMVNDGRPIDQVVDMISNSPEAKIQAMYREILGRAGAASELQYWLGEHNKGKSLDAIRADISWLKAQGSYATGGYTGDMGLGQIAGVVHGQEFVAHAEATRRWRPQLEAMNAGRAPSFGGDSSAIVAELRALRQDNARMTAEVERLGKIVAAGAQAQVEATRGTTAAVDKQTDQSRRDSGRRAA